MNLFFECIKNLYTREDYEWLNNFYDHVNCFAIAKVISRDDASLQYVKCLTKYLFNIKNEHSLILLHTLIPKRYKAPWIQYKKKKEDVAFKLHKKIMKYLRYSEREYKYVKHIIERKFNNKLLLEMFGLK